MVKNGDWEVIIQSSDKLMVAPGPKGLMAFKGGRAQDWNPLERLASTGRTPTLRQEGRGDVGILENWV